MGNSDQSGVQKDAPRGFLSALLAFISDIFKDVVSSILVVVLTFCFATVVTAGMLWYYQWPLFLSPVGGFIVLGVMLLLWNDS
mgnify:FL=1